MGIKLVEIVDDVTVIVGISDANLAILKDFDVVIAVAYVKAFDSAVCFNNPAERAVFFLGGDDSRYVRDEVIIVKACTDHGCGFLVYFVKGSYESYLYAALVEKRDIHLGAADGEETSRFELFKDLAALGFEGNEIILAFFDFIVFCDVNSCHQNRSSSLILSASAAID